MNAIAARLGIVVLVVFIALSTQSVSAQNNGRNDWLTDRLSITAGAFFPSTDTLLRADARDGSLGTRFRYEEQLELSSSDTSVDASVLWRFAKRHSLELEYFDIRRDGQTTLDAEISFGDSAFGDQFEIESFLDTQVIRLGYGFSFFRSPDYELGVHVGVHVTDIDTGITAVGESISGQLSERVGTTAPLPVIGLYGAYRFGERWLVYGRAQYFELEYDDYDGRMQQVMLGLEHDTFKRVSLGLGYRLFDVVVDVEDGDWTGEVDFRYDGPSVYFRVGIR